MPRLSSQSAAQSRSSLASNSPELAERPLNADLTGLVLDGRYKVLGLIGQGAMAVVYKLKDLETGEIYAGKALKYADQDLMSRFAREVLIYEKLKHPNIVDARECLHLKGKSKVCVSVMELIEGVSLEKILKNGDKFEDLNQFLSIFSQVLDGIEFAHNLGVIHRDIKPDNVILCSSSEGNAPRIKILDFGLAKIQEDLQRLTKSGVVLGTPAYMSPEQCIGDSLDPRSDIYSLGVLFFEMLTGSLPYDEEAAVNMMQAHCDASRTPLTLTAADLKNPAMLSLQRVISKMLAYDPEDRYENINSLKRDLHIWWQTSQFPNKGNASPFSFVEYKTEVPDEPADEDITVEERLALDDLLVSQLRSKAEKAAANVEEGRLPRRKAGQKLSIPYTKVAIALIVVSTIVILLASLNLMRQKQGPAIAPKEQKQADTVRRPIPVETHSPPRKNLRESKVRRLDGSR